MDLHSVHVLPHVMRKAMKTNVTAVYLANRQCAVTKLFFLASLKD